MATLAANVKTFAIDNSEVLLPAIIVVVLVLAGFGFMLTRKSREWAKEQILWVLVGTGIVLGATTLTLQIVSAFQF